jgi:predicted RecA/RadA family phage recombinase
MGKSDFVESGDRIDFTPVSAVTAGDLVDLGGGLVGFTDNDVAAGSLGSASLTGIRRGVKSTGAIAKDQIVYWNPTANPVVGTAGSGAWSATPAAGAVKTAICLRAALSDDPQVLLLQLQPIYLRGPVEKLIADPGNAGAIPVNDSGYCPIVTAGSETRTLAAPSFIGQELLLYIKTDGGTCVITVASAINQTGNNTITMADVRDVIRLVAIESGANRVWHIVSSDGAVLSTV